MSIHARRAKARIEGTNYYHGRLIFGFGFVYYPNWLAPGMMWYAFRSNVIDGPIYSTRSKAVIHWLLSRLSLVPIIKNWLDRRQLERLRRRIEGMNKTP